MRPHARRGFTLVETTVACGVLCLADGGAFNDIGVNYRGNTGTGPGGWTSAEYTDGGNGLLPEFGLVSPARVRDGLSHTALFSERLRGSDGPPINLQRDAFGPVALAFTADELILAARASARPDNPARYYRHGHSWFWAGRDRTLYNHAQVPNGVIPDLLNSNILAPQALATARSFHPGGVNVLWGDGSVRFVAETIEQAVWRGMGTRSGNELVD